METCRGCGAFLMPDWDTCKICGHDPAAPDRADAEPAPAKGRRARRAPKAPKAPKTATAAPALAPEARPPVPAPAPVRPVVGPSAIEDDDDEGYEDFDPDRVPMILLVLLIVIVVGYFSIYLPTRDDDDERLPGTPGVPAPSVRVPLPQDQLHGITVEV